MLLENDLGAREVEEKSNRENQELESELEFELEIEQLMTNPNTFCHFDQRDETKGP